MTLERWGRLLLVGGLVMAALGLLFVLLGRLGVARLPGDITIQGKSFTLYLPLGLSLLISVIATVLVNLLHRR